MRLPVWGRRRGKQGLQEMDARLDLGCPQALRVLTPSGDKAGLSEAQQQRRLTPSNKHYLPLPQIIAHSYRSLTETTGLLLQPTPVQGERETRENWAVPKVTQRVIGNEVAEPQCPGPLH